MYAIVDIAGQQFKVEKDTKLYVHRLEGEEGSELDLVNVLLVDNEGEVVVGTPTVENTVVKAKILSHLEGRQSPWYLRRKEEKGIRNLTVIVST
jgi:large subunit ribosomal protein L21